MKMMVKSLRLPKIVVMERKACEERAFRDNQSRQRWKTIIEMGITYLEVGASIARQRV